MFLVLLMEFYPLDATEAVQSLFVNGAGGTGQIDEYDPLGQLVRRIHTESGTALGFMAYLAGLWLLGSLRDQQTAGRPVDLRGMGGQVVIVVPLVNPHLLGPVLPAGGVGERAGASVYRGPASTVCETASPGSDHRNRPNRRATPPPFLPG